MGVYINPEYGTKEGWLKEYGTLICTSEQPVEDNFRWANIWHDLFNTEFPVALIDNGSFKAAAVCWCKSEFERFNDPDDPRLITWYVVSATSLKKVLAEEEFDIFIRKDGNDEKDDT